MIATTAERDWPLRRGAQVLPYVAIMAILLASFAVVFYPSITSIVEKWSSAEGVLSHGYLVAIISIYLFVRAVPEFVQIPTKPNYWALPFLLGMSLIWLLGRVATVVAIETVILPISFLTAIGLVFGLKAARLFSFPVLFLYLALPAIEHFRFIFQAITVEAVGVLIWITGLPALVDGNIVRIPQGVFEIAGGCSGLNYVVAGLSLAILYGHLFYQGYSPKALLAIAVLVAAMVGNWLRVYAIVVIGYRTDMQSELVNDHLFMGWLIFIALMIPMHFLAGNLESDATPEKTRTSDPLATSGKSMRSNQHWIALFAAVLAMACGPLWAKSVLGPETDGQLVNIEFPGQSSRWIGPNESNWDWTPHFSGVDAERVAQYSHNEAPVLVYANAYLSQSQGRELVYFSNDIAGNWQDSGVGREYSVEPAGSANAEFGSAVVSSYAGEWLIRYRYQHGSRFDTDEGEAKLSQALEALRGRPMAGVVVFAAQCQPNCDAASELLTTFYDDVWRETSLATMVVTQ